MSFRKTVVYTGKLGLCCGFIASGQHREISSFAAFYSQINIRSIVITSKNTIHAHYIKYPPALFCIFTWHQTVSNPVSWSTHLYHSNGFYWVIAWLCLDFSAGITLSVIALHHQRPQLIFDICMFSVLYYFFPASVGFDDVNIVARAVWH